MPELFERLKVALADRYTIERELGAGGMATVYLAEDLKHHRKVALKVLRPELAAALGPERFLREIEISANLNHPHILPLFDSGKADGFLYYVMPYIEGESLRDRLEREKQLPIDDALQIASEVADGLSHAHSFGVIHRDIKPANILLSGGHAVVADFGVARAVTAAGGEKLTATGLSVGTPAYMSPEQGTGEVELDGRTDVYGLGCVLYEMLAGEPPFTGPTAQAIIARHVSERPPSLQIVRPTVSAAMQRTVEKALSKVPADRFATTSEFLASLETPAEPAAREGRDQPEREPSGPAAFRFLQELRKRLVLHVGLAYLALAWLAVEFTRTLAAHEAIEPWVTPIVVLFLAVGLPFLLVTAWAQEQTPALGATIKTHRFWPRWAEKTRPGHLLSVLAVLIIALFAGQRILARAPTAVGPAVEAASVFNPRRIAVLPFEDQSQRQEFGHLALVFPQYLVDQLSQLDALNVVPSAAVKRYYQANAPLDSIISDLKAGTLVEGTIIGSEKEIRIIVRLTDANKLAVIHSKQQQRPRRETLALLDDFTNEVAGALRRELGVVIRDLERMAGTASNEAWELYARGREWAEEAKDLWQAGAPDPALRTYERADSTFARAQSVDPAWIDPIVERGWVTYQKAQILKKHLRSRDPAMLRHGIELADRSLALVPGNARALDLRGTLRYWLRETVDQAEESVSLRESAELDLLAATSIDPRNAHAWHFLSNVLRAAGRHPEAKRAAERALEADQYYEERGNVFTQLCLTSLDNRQWDEVTRWCEAGRREFPRNNLILNTAMVALASSGGPEPDVDKAWQLLEDFLESNPPQDRPKLRPSATLYVADVLARAGLTDSARAVIRQARAAEISPDPMNDYNEAYARLLLGEKDQALRLLQRYVEASPGRKEALAWDWWFDPLRSDPRFQELVR